MNKNTVKWMAVALFSLCLMAVAAKELSGAIPVFQVLFIRSVIGLFIVTAIILLRRQHALLVTQKPALHLFRNMAHFAGQYGWFLGIGLLPLADVFALEFTAPLWTALLAVLFLGEAMHKSKVTAVVLGFIGILVIVKPGSSLLNAAVFYVLASAIAYAVTYTLTKHMARDQAPITILFYMCLLQLPIGFLLSIDSWQQATLLQWAWLLVVAISALIAHYCISSAMKTGEATTVVTIDFLRLPLIAIVGVVFYNEALDASLILGAALILFANWINLRAR